MLPMPARAGSDAAVSRTFFDAALMAAVISSTAFTRLRTVGRAA